MTLVALVTVACAGTAPPTERPSPVPRAELTRAARAWLRCDDEALVFAPVTEQTYDECIERAPSRIPSDASDDLIEDLGGRCVRSVPRVVAVDAPLWRVSGCGVEDTFRCEHFCGARDLSCLPEAMLGRIHCAGSPRP